MKISSFKLVTGEEVIGYCRVCGDYVILSKPRRIMLMTVEDSCGIAFMPWSHCNTNADAHIHQQNIVSEIPPTNDIVTAYTQKVSNLDLSTPKIIS